MSKRNVQTFEEIVAILAQRDTCITCGKPCQTRNALGIAVCVTDCVKARK